MLIPGLCALTLGISISEAPMEVTSKTVVKIARHLFLLLLFSIFFSSPLFIEEAFNRLFI